MPSAGKTQIRRAPTVSKTKRVSKVAEETSYFDFNLLVIVIFLTAFGLVMLYSSSSFTGQRMFGDDMHFFRRQAIFSVIGVVIMMIVSKINYHFYAVIAREAFVISMILVLLVQTPLGRDVNGARRWINLPGGMSFQPAEIVKITIILIFAYELCRQGKRTHDLRGALQIMMIAAVAAGGILFLTRNLSTAIIVMGIASIMYFVVHPKTKPFIALIMVGVAGISVFVWYVINHYAADPSGNFRMRRIISWQNPENFTDGGSFQMVQGLYAIGSGGFWGRGLGNSTQKYVIPEVQNDMILAIVAEELGVFGVIILLVLFGMMLYRLMFIAQNAPDLFGSLLTIGIFAHISLQVVLNIAVVTNLIPTTGVSLPFVSFGGTAMVFLLAEMGIALNISRTIKIKE